MEKILRECEHTQAAAQSEFKEAAMEIQKLEETVEQGKNERKIWFMNRPKNEKT